MSVLRLTRLTVDADRTDEMLARRADLIEAVRRTTDGLTDTRLARVDEETWLDVWRWESGEALDQVSAVAPGLPEAKAAFAVVRDAQVERYDLVDER
ncbi:antibiotic biosynthesis monooxygenase [Kribbella sp. NPDC051770]|uniref:antibiotic biosynthesis monooxygenase n=1 Tax=Kribbella sp. NPDC051770 TaxID=3155413 RepID=UPI003424BECC